MVESSGLSLTMGSVSLDSVLRECHALVEEQAKAHNVSLHFLAKKSKCWVHADQKRLKQAILNLLSNAIKYNNQGGKVAVQLDYTAPARVRLSIADTGLGLSAEQIAQLYQPFNRLGREAGAEAGTGIGLVMTKRIVEMMGGTVGVHSTVGLGSTFWIDLKLAKQGELAQPGDVDGPTEGSELASIRAARLVSLAESDDEEEGTLELTEAIDVADDHDGEIEGEATATAAGEGQANADSADDGEDLVKQIVIRQLAVYHAKPAVLYVEDNVANLSLVESLVGLRSDLRLLSARDGLAGLAMARAELPHVILMDINLPGLSGIDIHRILCLDPLTAHIPVIALSANAMPSDISEGLAAGFYLYLTKPVKNEELMHSLDLALTLARTRRRKNLGLEDEKEAKPGTAKTEKEPA